MQAHPTQHIQTRGQTVLVLGFHDFLATICTIRIQLKLKREEKVLQVHHKLIQGQGGTDREKQLFSGHPERYQYQ